MVWYGYDSGITNEQIYYATNASGIWSAPALVSTQSDYSQSNSRMALDPSGHTYVAWEGYDSSQNEWDIYYSTNAGGTWSAPVNITNGDFSSPLYPDIAVDLGRQGLRDLARTQ